MIATGLTPTGLEPPSGGRIALWAGAAGLALFAHLGGAILASRQPETPPPEFAAPPAIEIDLAPMAAAPEEPPSTVETPEVPDVEQETPEDPTPTPPEPEPEPQPEPEPEPEPVVELPQPELPAPVELPEPQAEAPTPPRPVSRPTTLVEVEQPEPEKPPPPPSVASRVSTRAEVRAERPTTTAAPATAAGDRGVAPAKWQAAVMARLERMKRYPPGSRRRREEGVAYVRFVVDDGGNVRSAQISRSSGHAELDEAVVALVRRASPLPAPPAGAPRSVTAPVTFTIR